MKHKWKIIALAVAVIMTGGYFLVTYLPLGHESHREEQKQQIGRASCRERV